MKYLNKTFSVSMYANGNLKCSACGQEAKVFYPGHKCPTCYFNQKQAEKVKELNDKSSDNGGE